MSPSFPISPASPFSEHVYPLPSMSPPLPPSLSSPSTVVFLSPADTFVSNGWARVLHNAWGEQEAQWAEERTEGGFIRDGRPSFYHHANGGSSTEQITQQLCCYTLDSLPWMEWTRQATWPSSPYRPHLEKVFTDNVWTECSLANMYNHMFLTPCNNTVLLLDMNTFTCRVWNNIKCFSRTLVWGLSRFIGPIKPNPTPGKAVQDGSIDG